MIYMVPTAHFLNLPITYKSKNQTSRDRKITEVKKDAPDQISVNVKKKNILPKKKILNLDF